MIEAFRHDELVDRFGGRFKLCVVIQRRWVQLLQGAKPMVESKGLTDLEVVVKEILEGKLDVESAPEEVPEDDDALGPV